MKVNNRIQAYYIHFLTLIIISGLCLDGCKETSSFVLDDHLSCSLEDIPNSAETISEIRIYETTVSNFLSTSEISKLVPLRVFSTKAEINGFCETMVRGHTSNEDTALRNFHYLPKCYHIIGVSLDGTKYGYLKVQISSDTDKPIVARVQKPDGTNSFVYKTLIPAVLEDMSQHKL